MLAYLKRTTVKVDDEVDSQMRQEAARRGLALSDWVREAMVAHLPSGSVTAGPHCRVGGAQP
ncbi:MAG: CopG family transcriptional regulator [Nakamurella sp.]